MTVKQLIAKLQTFPADMEVCCEADGGHDGYQSNYDARKLVKVSKQKIRKDHRIWFENEYVDPGKWEREIILLNVYGGGE